MTVTPMNTLETKLTKTNPDVLSAHQTLDIEISGLEHLKASLGADFVRALDFMENVKGRVIVTGMGKSGHVARKIAATLSSTWTPAFFVHPGEASHGDLGMIKRGEDVIIALSASGSTSELSDTIEFAKRFSVPLIGITANADSLLGQKSDALLLLPNINEACPNNQAPTTSTTMMMALGDCLAMALLERRNITPEQFKVFHPGGKLGRTLSRVSDVMQKPRDIDFLKPSADFVQTVKAITETGNGCIAISEGGETLLGWITDGDIRRASLSAETPSLNACDIMTKNPRHVLVDDLGAEAMATMSEKQITNLPVMDGEKLVGILHIHDCLRAAIA